MSCLLSISGPVRPARRAARVKLVAAPLVAAPLALALALLALGACGTAHQAPATANRSGPAAITSEALIPQDSPQDSVNGSTTSSEPAIAESATDLGPDATATPPQPVGLTQSLPGAAAGSSQLASRMPMSDSRFAQQVISNGATEISLARIALLRAQSDEVRDFARRLLVDHRRMAIAMDDFGLERGFMVNWRLSQVGESVITRMRAMPSAQFDGAYVSEMVRAHEAAVALLERQADGSSETATLARDSLPTIREHLARARELQNRV